MKQALLTCTLFLLFTQLKADYNGYHIAFSITYTNGVISKGYAYVAEHYFTTDSMRKTSYLKSALDQDFGENKGFTYFEERIAYRYITPGSKKKNKLYSLSGRKTVSPRSIRRIKIETIEEESYLYGISSITLQDTSWTNKAPVKCASYGGYLCGYDIFIHQNSEKVERILLQLKSKQKKYLRHVKEIEDSGQEWDIEYGDKTDKEFAELIRQLDGEKVVVISFCTC